MPRQETATIQLATHAAEPAAANGQPSPSGTQAQIPAVATSHTRAEEPPDAAAAAAAEPEATSASTTQPQHSVSHAPAASERHGIDAAEAPAAGENQGAAAVPASGPSFLQLSTRASSVALPSLREQPPLEWLCPISLELMLCPTVLVQTQQTYERYNIERWLTNGGAICPLTGAPLHTRELRDNDGLERQIHAWLREQGYTPELWAEQMQLLKRSMAPGSFSVSANSSHPGRDGLSQLSAAAQLRQQQRRRPTLLRKLIAFSCCFGSWDEFAKAEEMRRAWVHTLDRPPAGLPPGYVTPRNPNEIPCYPAGWPSIRLFSSHL